MNIGAVLREAWVSARAQPVASLVSIIIIGGMCASVLLTTGRTVGAERAVLSSIDSAGTRSIVVRADTGAGVDTSVLGRLANLAGVGWIAGFGPPEDVTNEAIPGGSRVPLRTLWTTEKTEAVGALASRDALDRLGMSSPVGAVIADTGRTVAITGEFDTPEQLRFLEPLVVAPSSPDGELAPIALIVVIADSADLVEPLAAAIGSVMGADEPAKVSIETSGNLVSLRAAVQGQLGTFGRNLVLVIFAGAATLVAAILYALVLLRRRDFGRRRALGARRSLIVQLLLAQVGLTSSLGALLGCGAAVLALVAARDPLPGVDFIGAVAVLAVAVGVVAAVVPAIVASRRDPITELRLP